MGHDVQNSFLKLLNDSYGAPFEILDFATDSSAATRRINLWVEEQTRHRIRDIVSGLDNLTRMVLVNAVYLKAPWTNQFNEYCTKPRPFHMPCGSVVDVPTMTCTGRVSYAKRDGFTALGIPYRGGDISFLILLPERVDGLAELERRVTADLLSECATMHEKEVVLYLPKFKIGPPALSLRNALQSLGMRTAFDQPHGSANFHRIAHRGPEDYLCLSEVVHKTFLNLDENGTEAAAATGVVLGLAMIKPAEVRVDHAFLFAVQHRQSGACLFLGRLADPH